MVVKKSTKRTCITCTAKGVNKDKVPLWSKKDGLYSMLPKVINCEDTYNPNKNELKAEEPEIVGTKVDIPLEIKETNRWVFYWAAEPGSSLDGDVVEDPATSYGDESNRGLVKTDSDGNAMLVLNCPKLYKEDKQMYPRHVHYTVLTEDDVWSTNIGTLEIMCKLPFETMEEIVKKKTYLILNALSKESYDEKHIPNSVLCHYEALEGLKKQPKDTIIKKLVKKQMSKLPKVKKYIDNADSIKEVPIIVYCAHEDCDASSKLAEHLYDCGYFNVMEYPGGLKEWFSESTDRDLFEDVPSEEEDDDELKPDKKLKEDEEIIVYDGIEYIHNIKDDYILTMDDMEPVGKYDGENIEWNSFDEYNEHLKRKGEDPEEDEGEDEEDEEEKDEEEDEEEKDEEEGDEEDEEDEEVEEYMNRKQQEAKGRECG